MNLPALPPRLPTATLAGVGALLCGLAGAALLALSHGRAAMLLSGCSALLVGGLLLWLAILRHNARGTWEKAISELGLRPAEVEPATLESLGSRHAVLEKRPGRGIERILRGRVQDREVFVIQAYRERVPGFFVTLLSLLGMLFAVAAALAGEVIGDPRAGSPRRRTTVLLLPRQTNEVSGTQTVGEWTVDCAPTSTAIYVEGRDVEPSQLGAFLEAALRVVEGNLAR